MGCGDRASARIGERFEGRLCDGRALRRIGSDAYFVETDQRVCFRVPQDLGQVRHRRRKGRKAFLDVLMVADIGLDAVDEVYPCARVGRDVQAGANHERSQRHRLESDGFPPALGPDSSNTEKSSPTRRSLATHSSAGISG